MHGVNQGVLAIVGSGNGSGFLQAFVSGALGSIAASGWQSVVGKDPLGTIAFGALSGGIGAELTGGNFFQGFAIGGVVAGLNHVMHAREDNEKPIKRQKLKKNIDVSNKILKSTEAISALDEYIATATKSQKNKLIGKIGKIAGNIGNATSVAVSGLEYYNGEISGLELTFDLGSQATSIWVSTEVGAALGGPYGFAAGVTVGAVGEFVVKPIYKNVIKPSLVVPTQNAYNSAWTNFYNEIIFNITRYK